MQERELAGNRRDRVIRVAFVACVFAFLLLFFGRIHPLMMHDGDDWGYASYSRGGLPIWGYWNPIKVFPETALPVCAYLASYLVMPFVGDFSWSLTYVFAFVVSLAITIYVLMLMHWLGRCFKLPAFAGVMISALFVVLHFVVFRSQSTDNVHLFYCWNVNTYFNYLLPGLINAGLVLFLDVQRNGFLSDKRVGRQSVLCLAVYLAVFSNLYASQILAIYCGVRLMMRLASALAKKEPLRGAVKENVWLIVVLALWLVSMLFELSGGRAGSMDSEAGYTRSSRARCGICLTGFARSMANLCWFRRRRCSRRWSC